MVVTTVGFVQITAPLTRPPPFPTPLDCPPSEKRRGRDARRCCIRAFAANTSTTTPTVSPPRVFQAEP